MANQVELVVTVEVDNANSSIKSVNTSLSSVETTAAKAARGASAGIDGMTAAMVKGATAGNLLADAIKTALRWAKEFTVDAVMDAAHVQRMEVATISLAKAHGINAEAVREASEAIQKLDIEDEQALEGINKLIIAGIDLGKSEGLAMAAQDLAALRDNLNIGDALESMLQAIEFGNARALRAVGLRVEFDKQIELAELKLGKQLSETEKVEIRRQAVMTAAAKATGAGVAAAGTAEKQMALLHKEIRDLQKEIGAQFVDEFRAIIAALRDLVKWLGDNVGLLEKFAQVALMVGGVLATYKIVTGIVGITHAVEGLTTALAAGRIAALGNPITLLLTGGVAAGAILYKELNDMQAARDRWMKGQQDQATRRDVFSGKTKIDELRKRGMSDDQIRALLTGHTLAPGEQPWKYEGPKLTVAGAGDNIDAEIARLKAAAELKKEITKRQADADVQAHEYYMRAIEERKGAEHDMARSQIEDSMHIIESTQSATEAAKQAMNVLVLSQEEYAAGIAKIREEEKREIAQRSTFVDASGVVRQFKLSGQALEEIHLATTAKIKAFDMRFAQEEARRVETMLKAGAARTQKLIAELYLEPMRQQTYVWEQGREAQERIDDQSREARLATIDQRKDLELAQLESVDAITIQDKIKLEQMKTAIEVQAIKDRAKVQLEMIDAMTERNVAAARQAAMAQGIFYEPYLKEIESKVRELGQQQRDALTQATTSAVDVQQAKGAAATRRIVVDEYKSMFQSIKEQAGGVFDALVTKSQSVWSAIANSFKTAILTAIKDVVTSRVAALLTQMITGSKVTLTSPGGAGGNASGVGGILGSLGGLFGIGAVPVFGGTSPTTPPFIPGGSTPMMNSLPSAAANAQGGGAAGNGMFNLANLKGIASWKNLYSAMAMGGGLMMLSGVQKGSSFNTIGGGAMMGAGIGLMGGPIGAIGGAGIGLAMNGLRQGGFGGLAQTTAGGAMLGFNLGGPLGAAIGAGVGAIAGTIRLFIKGAQEKAREKIKQLYGVEISDSSFLKQIVDMTKQAYGGNLDVALRSKDIRDLILLYAQSTGQNAKGMPAQMSALSLVQSGGSLFQSPGYQNGTQLAGLGGLPTLDSVGKGALSGGGLVVNISVPGAKEFFEKETVSVMVANPRAVQTATLNATKQNAGRRELAALQMGNGLVTA